MRRIKWIVLGFGLTLVITTAVTALAASREKTIAVSHGNIMIVVNRNPLTLTNSRGEEVEPFIYNDTVYAPVRAIAEALGADVRWLPEGIVNIWGHRCSLDTMPRIEGNTIIRRECIVIGFSNWEFDLAETVSSGVIWEFVSISDLNILWDQDLSDFLRDNILVYFDGYRYIVGCADEDYAIRRFAFGFSRVIPKSTFSITFEQVLGEHRLGNFLIYEIHMLSAGPCWEF